MKVTPYHPARQELIAPLYEVMSGTDRFELDTLSRGKPLDALGQALAQSSYSFAYAIDGTPVVMGGLKLLGTPAIVWMVAATPILFHHKKTFLRYSRHELVVMQALAQGQPLRAMVDRRWNKSVKWLKWLGFDEKGSFTFEARPGVILECAA